MLIALIGGLLALYLYAIKPNSPSKKNLKPFLGRYYAHRGLFDNSSDAPENSLNAISLAVEQGYGVEFDVRITRDKILVVIHDNRLQRAAGMNKLVTEMTFDELREITLFHSQEEIPTLHDVLNLVDGRVPIIVELKQDGGGDTTICDVVSPVLDDYNGDYMVESFNPVLMIWYKKNRPSVIRGQLSTNHLKEGKKGLLLNLSLQYLLFNFLVKPDFIAYNHIYGNNLSLFINTRLFGITTVAYTLKSQKELDRNRTRFDILIFDSFIPE
ncbi:glycerophosphodiester phosphodiesterase family protein [Gudongella sp. SC589]|jgi:glycerophosphoryl diester phosphodiesterase|uniref:glycerophosphodiester phosphodiesterase family protein n=1 Tax=Gudongella sp. SC589 TaxID=3385990 RepID=UPI00390480BE